MFVNIALASVAVLGSLASAQSLGQATVVNLCQQTVYLANTPSADGIHTTDFATLNTGDSYHQTYTQLGNNNGWSLKLGYDQSLAEGDIMQYEYTYQGDGIVWFDLSKVDGNPFGWFWNISSSDDACTVAQRAYLFPTDNSAMQPSCSSSTDVTVTLCQWPDLTIAEQNGVSSLGGAISSIVAAIAPSSTAAPAAATTTSTPSPSPTTPSTTAAPATTAPPTVSSAPAAAQNPVSFEPGTGNGPAVPGFGAGGPHDLQADIGSTPTTLETSTSVATSTSQDGAVETVWVTDIVTEHITLTTTTFPEETPVAKRHEHGMHRHAHGHA